MKIYYELDVLAKRCKNRCPFAGTEFKGNMSPDCQVGSVECKNCKFCYGSHGNGLDYLFLNGRSYLKSMPYVKCCWGTKRLTVGQKAQWLWHQFKVLVKKTFSNE